MRFLCFVSTLDVYKRQIDSTFIKRLVEGTYNKYKEAEFQEKLSKLKAKINNYKEYGLSLIHILVLISLSAIWLNKVNTISAASSTVPSSFNSLIAVSYTHLGEFGKHNNFIMKKVLILICAFCMSVTCLLYTSTFLH